MELIEITGGNPETISTVVVAESWREPLATNIVKM